VNHFATDVRVPMSIPRRLFAWLAAQIKHVLLPRILDPLIKRHPKLLAGHTPFRQVRALFRHCVPYGFLACRNSRTMNHSVSPRRLGSRKGAYGLRVQRVPRVGPYLGDKVGRRTTNRSISLYFPTIVSRSIKRALVGKANQAVSRMSDHDTLNPLSHHSQGADAIAWQRMRTHRRATICAWHSPFLDTNNTNLSHCAVEACD
jgi:hypothetical protein